MYSSMGNSSNVECKYFSFGNDGSKLLCKMGCDPIVETGQDAGILMSFSRDL